MKKIVYPIAIFILFFLLSGCGFIGSGSAPAAPPSNGAASGTEFPDPTPLATATAAPPRNLTVCLGQEPNSLFPLVTLNSAARSVLGAIYDGPIDTFTNGYQPVILEKIPTIENGDAQITPVSVKGGDFVVDSQGNYAVLDYGVTVFPSGCSDDACAVKYAGQGDLKMDQMIVNFRMRSDVNWSDGTALTPADSVFAFKLASDKAMTGSKFKIDRTAAYEVIDDHTVQWWGIPGYVDAAYMTNFWTPLPKHLLENVPAAELAKGDVKAHPPVGWGAYTFQDWEPGSFISLVKNPNYFRAKEGLPYFEKLTFLFVKDAPSGISALVSGQCDILDTSVHLESELNLLTELQRSDQVKLLTSTTPLIERLDFGIKPASYDDGYVPAAGDRPNILADVRTRQGIAYCLDRQKVVMDVFNGISKVPDSFISPDHPLINKTIATYPFDTNKGIGLLEQAGWVDADNNPSTPRTAMGISGVKNGTPLLLNYVTTTALQRRQVSEILAQSLQQCGVGVNLVYDSQDLVYAPGPDGMLFGRKFDLAEYAIGTLGTEPPCDWFTTNQIPTVQNKWIGVNISGYSNTDFDALCRKAQSSWPGKPEYQNSYAEVQNIFANDLPSIPLYMRIKAAATRRDLCNFSLDAFTLNDLWNIEDFQIGSGCIK